MKRTPTGEFESIISKKFWDNLEYGIRANIDTNIIDDIEKNILGNILRRITLEEQNVIYNLMRSGENALDYYFL